MIPIWLGVLGGAAIGWFFASAFAAGKREDENKMFAMLRRGYQRRVERAYGIGYKRGFRHGTPMSVKELLGQMRARQPAQPGDYRAARGVLGPDSESSESRIRRQRDGWQPTGSDPVGPPPKIVSHVQPAQRPDLAGE